MYKSSASQLVAVASAAVLMLGAGPCLADEPESLITLPAEVAGTISLPESAAVVPDDVLGNESAMARIEIGDIMINDQDLNGEVTGNVATGNTNGHNSIADNAFSGASGFATAIQNTGNNVLIQNSTIINVTLDP